MDDDDPDYVARLNGARGPEIADRVATLEIVQLII
jgi:hypothetical protein